MSLVSGTWTKYDAKGLRESLHDVIYDISPEETVFVSSCGRGKAKGTLEEWQTDALAAAITTNAALEGDDASFTTPSATVRVGNYTQIMRKTLILSGTSEVVDKAGRKSEKAYQIAKRGKEIKRDLEATAFAAQAGDAGGVGTARTFAALNAWVKTNVDKHSGGGNPVYTSGVPAAARTDGTQRAFTETIHKAVISAMWASGATLKQLYVGPFNKGVVSGFAGIATRNIDMSRAALGPHAIVATADVYVSDFGTLRVMPSRHQRERDAWYIDPELVSFMYLRPFQVEELAKTGDAEKSLLLMEVTMKVSNQAGLGLAADLNAS